MFVPRSSDTQRLGRKLHKRESVARSFVAKSVYGYPFTSALIEALKTTPSLRKICGFEKVSVKKLSKQKPVPKKVGVESRRTVGIERSKTLEAAASSISGAGARGITGALPCGYKKNSK